MEDLKYINKFIDENLIDLFIEDLDWEDKTKMRREYFMANSNIEYKYLDNINAPSYSSKPFHPKVLEIMNKINKELNLSLDICFLNLYMNSRNGLGWHADDAISIDHSNGIAVVSFGEEREIWWKLKDDKGIIPDSNKKKLENGSLFYMPPGFQDTHFHRIPKHDRECKPRVSLTFRKYKK